LRSTLVKVRSIENNSMRGTLLEVQRFLDIITAASTKKSDSD
jgi:hypothetical protein